MFQFNCRKLLTNEERATLLHTNCKPNDNAGILKDVDNYFDSYNVPKYYLDCQLYQRSGDVFLGVPFNIASYALLTHIIAKICNMIPGEFIHTFGDAHIYNNHFEQVELQLSRELKSLPKMILNPNIKNIFDFTFEDFTLEGYEPHPHIKGIVAV